VFETYLWGTETENGTGTYPHTAEALQNKIRNVVAWISADELQRLQHVSQVFVQ
jgi:hypothetical protein